MLDNKNQADVLKRLGGKKVQCFGPEMALGVFSFN